MRSDIVSYIHTCPICQKFWIRHKPPVLQHRTLEAYEPFQILSCDWLGPFPPDDRGNTYIHAVTDAASRKLILFAHPSISAKNSAEDLLQIFGNYALCQQIHSDNASVYTSQIIEELTKLLDIPHSTITPHSHKSNGQSEVFNREVLRHLNAIIFSKDILHQWSYRVLPIVSSIINNVINSVTGLSPNEYLYGSLFTTHRGLATPFPPNSRPVTDIISEIHRLQPLIIAASQRWQAAHLDSIVSKSLRTPLDEFHPGEFVLVKYPNRPPSKVNSKYRGPFLVQARHSDSYICQDLTTGKPLNFHADRLVLFHPSSTMAPIDIAARDNQEYVIDFISAHQGSPKHKSSLSFLVHWLGFEEEEATWEPLQSLRDTEALEVYCHSQPQLRNLIK
jgi:hypothetical protein